jgi:hypothetical protein
MLSHSMNEPSTRSDSKLCPICKAKIPFSLALHMVAAHSPNALERSVETPDMTFRDAQASALQQSQSRAFSDSTRPPRSARGKSGYERRKGKRRH